MFDIDRGDNSACIVPHHAQGTSKQNSKFINIEHSAPYTQRFVPWWLSSDEQSFFNKVCRAPYQQICATGYCKRLILVRRAQDIKF